MDKMMVAFDEFKAKAVEGETTPLQFFQAGYSASAASMRAKALEVVKEVLGAVPNQNDLTNSLLTKIGELPDIEP